MGHPDVDRLLGGGLPLGCVLLVIEADASSRAHLPLLRLFLGEGVACGHECRWVVSRAPKGGAASFLPAQQQQQADSSSSAATTAKEAPGGGGKDKRQGEEGGGADDGDGDGLQIAWQYRKYIRNPSEARAAGGNTRVPTTGSAFVRRSTPSAGGGGSGGGSAGGSSGSGSGGGSGSSSSSSAVKAGIGRAWCHQHDLSRSMGRESFEAAVARTFETVECCRDCAAGPRRPLAAACSSAVAFFDGGGGGGAAAGAGGPPAAPPAIPLPVTQVRRLLVQSLGALEWLEGVGGGSSSTTATTEADVVRAVLRVRQAAQRPSPATCGACAVVSVDPTLLSASALARLVHACDAAVRVAPLPDDAAAAALLPDAPSAVALLQLLKAPSAALQRQPAVDDRLFVLRSRRKTVRITPVEVDPDAEADEAAGNGGGGGGGSKGGLGCATGRVAGGGSGGNRGSSDPLDF
jgi:elongator complex protein 4